ncbi:hypothetical protein [Sporisorium scitamineum]|uniref:Uncharacterized protein n=1 Tax=Sporisorium scitamineum TaxID=49012 RepID=A0A0F7RT88_9BASI|nr:hypothetical protein [Sporisorium scitamineum]
MLPGLPPPTRAAGNSPTSVARPAGGMQSTSQDTPAQARLAAVSSGTRCGGGTPGNPVVAEAEQPSKKRARFDEESTRMHENGARKEQAALSYPSTCVSGVASSSSADQTQPPPAAPSDPATATATATASQSKQTARPHVASPRSTAQIWTSFWRNDLHTLSRGFQQLVTLRAQDQELEMDARHVVNWIESRLKRWDRKLEQVLMSQSRN